MGKGILLELNGRQAVVLTPEGEFKQVPAPRRTCDIGDEIEFAEVRQAPIWQRWGVAAAAAAVLLLAPVGYQTWSLAQPVAVVTVEINPGMEFTVNKRAQVLRVAALNADGEQVISGLNWKKQPVEQVVADATALAIEQSKLDPADDYGAVVVAVAPVKEKLPAEMGAAVVEKTRTAVGHTISEKAVARQAEPKAHVVAAEVTAADKQEAREQGLNHTDLVAYKQLQAQEVEIDPQALTGKGIGKVIQELGLPGSVLDNGKGRKPEKDEQGNAGKGGGRPDHSQPVTSTPGDRELPGAASDNPGQGKGQAKDDDLESKRNNGNGKGNSGNGNNGNGKGNSGNGNNGNGNNGNNGKGNAKDDDVWIVPIIDLKIPKPGFLQNNEKSPRDDSPGAGAPGNNGNGNGNNGNGNGNKGNGKNQEKPGGPPDEKGKPDSPGNSGKSGNAGSNGSDKVGNNSQKDTGQKAGVPGSPEKEKATGSGNKKK